MSENDDLLRHHRSLQAKLPRAWNAFFALHGSLRPIQLDAMPIILKGNSILLTAPTAGGKTEAVAAPICELLAKHKWQGLSVLLITPTRALVNDLYARLEKPLLEMRIGIGRKTADHPEWRDTQIQFLITTPESTESLLTFHREALSNIRVLIIDEIHLLDGTPRGDQLRLTLRRLKRYRHHLAGADFMGMQMIAMSATVSDPRRIATAYLGPESVIISTPGHRSIDSRVFVASGDETARIKETVVALEQYPDVRKFLVFVNSRKLVDTAVNDFRSGRFSQTPTYGHHGSLSKAVRETVESRFKSDERAICVATMTLEVGIDIGDIDLVVCLDPPFSLSSFLQRIGRGCRRLNGKTRVLCIARDRASELIFQALVSQASLGVPKGPRAPFRRSVLIQQILAYLRQVDKRQRTQDQFRDVFIDLDDNAILTQENIDQLLQDMQSTALLDGNSGIYRPAAKGWNFIESSKIYTNITPRPIEMELYDVDTGEKIASVANIDQQSGGVRIAGRSYEVVAGETGNRIRVRQSGNYRVAPLYHAKSLPYAFDIGFSLSQLLAARSSELFVIRVGDGTVIFTWLGMLYNTVIAEALKISGLKTTAGPFHLLVQNSSSESLLDKLRTGIEIASIRKDFGTKDISRIVDLGPYYSLLSPALQTQAQQDWLDKEFLQTWNDQIQTLVEVPCDSDLANDLLCLMQ